MKRTSLFWLFFWSALGLSILCGLGIWQLVRLAEKREYLAELDQRIAAPPISLAEALRRSQAGEDAEFLKLSATGKFAPASLYKQATFKGGPGWQVLTLFTSDDGIAVLVDRGTIPEALRQVQPQPAEQPATVIGVVRRHDRGQGFFDPENDPASATWYWWDLPAMLGSQTIAPEARVAPFVLQALPQAGGAPLPVPENLDAGIPNNHLNYALTWFALALCLAVIAGMLARREISRRQA